MAGSAEPEALVAEARRQAQVGVTAITIAPPMGAGPGPGVEAVIATRDLVADGLG
jgi:hypothetical protein